MQKVYKDIHKKILQIIQCKCINWDVTDSRSSLVLSSEFVVNKNNPTGIGEKCQYFDHYFCFVCLQKLMQDFLSANGKKDLDTTEALNVMDRLLYYLQNTYHI